VVVVSGREGIEDDVVDVVIVEVRRCAVMTDRS
jgi:hypothetical protein